MLIFVIIMCVLFFLIMFGSHLSKDDENGWLLAVGTVLLAIFIIVFVLRDDIKEINFENGYKEGQINCINGNIEYELLEQENKELKWRKNNAK